MFGDDMFLNQLIKSFMTVKQDCVVAFPTSTNIVITNNVLLIARAIANVGASRLCVISCTSFFSTLNTQHSTNGVHGDQHGHKL